MCFDPAELEPLLADARLLEVRPAPDGVTLWLDCLRRDRAGQPLPPVQLTLLGLAAQGVTYDLSPPDARPSSLKVPAEAEVGGLLPWSLPLAARFAVNSRHDEDDLAVAVRADWLQGDRARFEGARVRLRIQSEPRPAWPELAVGVWVGAERFSARSAGAALTLEAWQVQHERWWSSWADGWVEEVALPAVDRKGLVPVYRGLPDLSYRPPATAPFAVGATDCPAALLKPLADWHEGHLARDWVRMATAFPHLDRAIGVHARAIEAECLGGGFGRWSYVRGLVSWWIEGARAGVVLTGVEHLLSGGVATEVPTRWHYALRQRNGRWAIFGVRAEAEPQATSPPGARRMDLH